MRHQGRALGGIVIVRDLARGVVKIQIAQLGQHALPLKKERIGLAASGSPLAVLTTQQQGPRHNKANEQQQRQLKDAR